jgi:hypothetical protein
VLIQIVQTHVLTRYSERTQATEIETIDFGPRQVCDAPIRQTAYVDEPRCHNVSSPPCYIGATGHKICIEGATVGIHVSAGLAWEKYSLRLAQLHDHLELIGFLDLLGYLDLVGDFGVAFVGAWWVAEVGRERIRWRAPASPLSR